MCDLHFCTKDRGLPSTLPRPRLFTKSFTLVSNIASTEAVRHGDAMGLASVVMSRPWHDRLASAGPGTLHVDPGNKSQRLLISVDILAILHLGLDIHWYPTFPKSLICIFFSTCIHIYTFTLTVTFIYTHRQTHCILFFLSLVVFSALALAIATAPVWHKCQVPLCTPNVPILECLTLKCSGTRRSRNSSGIQRTHLLVCDRELVVAIAHQARVRGYVFHLGQGFAVDRVKSFISWRPRRSSACWPEFIVMPDVFVTKWQFSELRCGWWQPHGEQWRVGAAFGFEVSNPWAWRCNRPSGTWMYQRCTHTGTVYVAKIWKRFWLYC